MIDILFYAAIVGGAVMAFAIGGNGAASSVASAYGARALTMGQVIFVAGIANFVGAVFLGGAVTATVAEYYGLTQLQTVTGFNVVSSAPVTFTPLVVTPANIGTAWYASQRARSSDH